MKLGVSNVRGQSCLGRVTLASWSPAKWDTVATIHALAIAIRVLRGTNDAVRVEQSELEKL